MGHGAREVIMAVRIRSTVPQGNVNRSTNRSTAKKESGGSEKAGRGLRCIRFGLSHEFIGDGNMPYPSCGQSGPAGARGLAPNLVVAGSHGMCQPRPRDASPSSARGGVSPNVAAASSAWLVDHKESYVTIHSTVPHFSFHSFSFSKSTYDL